MWSSCVLAFGCTLARSRVRAYKRRRASHTSRCVCVSSPSSSSSIASFACVFILWIIQNCEPHQWPFRITIISASFVWRTRRVVPVNSIHKRIVVELLCGASEWVCVVMLRVRQCFICMVYGANTSVECCHRLCGIRSRSTATAQWCGRVTIARKTVCEQRSHKSLAFNRRSAIYPQNSVLFFCLDVLSPFVCCRVLCICKSNWIHVNVIKIEKERKQRNFAR